jgi:PAS domain S-box-containing protein
MVLFCLGYFLCAWLGRAISPAGGTAVSYWLPGGLFVAVLLTNPTRDWPWLMAASLPANIVFDFIHDPKLNWLLIAGFCAGNIAQAGVGAWLVRKFIVHKPRLSSLKEFFGLLILAGMVGTAFGATIGATMLVRLGFADSFQRTWEIFWGGNLMAVLVLSPLVLVFGEAQTRRAAFANWSWLRMLEALAVFGGMLAFLWFVLVTGRGITSPKIPVLVFVIWSGMRFGLPGATIVVFLLAVTASFLTSHYLTGLSPEEIATHSYVFTLQIFVAISALVAFVPTIVLAERNRALRALRTSEESLRATLENTPHVAVQWFDGAGRVKYWNHASEIIYGWKAEEAMDRTLDQLIFSPERAANFIAVLERLKQSHHLGEPMEFPFRHRNGQPGVVLSTLFQIQLPDGEPRFVCMDVDLTERKFEENLNRMQANILEMISSGQPWRETLDALLRQIEAQSVEMHTSILLLDADGVHLRNGAAPSLPADYLKATECFAIGPAVGCCGTAAFRREAVYVADIASDPLWAPFKNLVLPHGLLACWSTPIFDAQKNVLGTFAIYYRQQRTPEPKHLRLIQMATHTAAICLLKHRAETEHQESVAREQKARIQYTFQLIASQESERKRIAAELHDSLGQNLLLIKNLAAMSLRDQEPAQTYERVASINHLATQCIAEARQISRDLHPHQIEHLGLKRALEMLLENTSQASDIKFTWHFDDLGENFTHDAATNLYRIVQESLNNILKHSHAKTVKVQLERDIHEIKLFITDDGCGFEAENSAQNKKGMGLKNIAERAHMLGGELNLDSAPATGTRIVVTIPLAAEVPESFRSQAG